MLPEYEALFEPLPPRAGEGLRIDGRGDRLTISRDELLQPTEETVVAASTTSLPSLHVTEAGEVVFGTVLGATPTIGTVPLDDSPAPTLSIPSSGTRYVVLNIWGTPDISTMPGGRLFFRPVMIGITITITVESTEPGPSYLVSDTGDFKVKLATFVDGVKTGQNGYGPIGGSVQDTLDGTGTGLLALTYASS